MGIFYIKREGKLTLFRMSIKKEPFPNKKTSLTNTSKSTTHHKPHRNENHLINKKKEKDKPMLKRSVINDKTPNLLSQADNEIKTLVSLKIRVIAG
ncbi:hypothetical protein IR148_07915 [Dysgonomonas mossii]|nr:hypothetical protein [Dysgonomonas mossii]MBF0760969.1 hypothetical protein [Dysgonomonas mossii]TFU89928.1 hypothetical protein E4T88_07900 [Dysgonomonas mossii]